MYERVKLITKADPLSNNVGVYLSGTENNPNINPCYNSFLLAHDVLEHQNGVEHMGELWDELQALGAIVHLRSPWEPADITHDLQHFLETHDPSDVPVPTISPVIEEEEIPTGFPHHWRQHLQIGYDKARAKWPNSLDCYERFCRIRDILFYDLYPDESFTLYYNRTEAFIR